MNTHRWSNFAEYSLLVGSGIGAVVSLTAQNIAATSLPITALVAMGMLNRRRVEHEVREVDGILAALEERFTTEMGAVRQRITALPTPESVTNLHRAAIAHSDRAILRFSQALEQAQKEMHQRLQGLENPDLGHLYQDMAQLQDQYTYVCSTLGNLNSQVQRLSHQPRMEATEVDISHIKTELMQLRVSLETLNGESKTAQATLHDAVRHLDRRLRQQPNPGDPHLLKGEVRELIRAVADLVPRRDFMALAEKLETLSSDQANLRRNLDTLPLGNHAIHQNGRRTHRPELEGLEMEVTRLSNTIEQVEKRLDSVSVPFDITAEIRGTTATYLSSLQWQLASLEQATQNLMQQQGLLKKLPGTGILHRLSAPEGSMVEAASPATAATTVQWLVALRGDEGTEAEHSAIDEALLSALDQAQERLVLVWPWSASTPLGSELVARFTQVLQRQCRLEIGWCHPGDRREGRLLHAINQQWQLMTVQRQRLKGALNQLLPLKQAYPDHFSFKILGTDEQFLVCDRAYAIVGIQELVTASSVFPTLDLRLKTNDAAVIDPLLQRFDDPTLSPEDTVAYFNRAATRYDLRDPQGAIADYTQVLRIHPKDVIALNNRAVAWGDQQQPQPALEDLTEALHLDPYQFAAWCNRGWLLLHQGNAAAAVTDFEQAIALDSTSPLPYFYRGIARQNLGDRRRAIADFTQTIQRSGQMALPYCYRSAAYQHEGDLPHAKADLETAASLFHAQSKHRALAQVTQVLNNLKQAEALQNLKLPTP